MGCANALAEAAPWQYKATDFSGYVRISPEELPTALIQRAQDDFRAAPAFHEGGPRVISLVRVARGSDGRTLASFSIAGVEDAHAIYVFDVRGRIVERYLHSFWGN
jgi:hypothetical protein